MEINIDKLKIEISKYNRLIDNYENCMLNIYNVLGQTSSYWNDEYSIKFQDHMQEEKKQFQNTISELTSLSEIYKYILEKYQKFGHKISCELSMRGEVRTKFTNYISNLNSVISRYNSLNLGFGPNVGHSIVKQKNRVVAIRKNVETLKYKIDATFDEIERIETEVNNKIAKINIKVVKESNVNDYI